MDREVKEKNGKDYLNLRLAVREQFLTPVFLAFSIHTRCEKGNV